MSRNFVRSAVAAAALISVVQPVAAAPSDYASGFADLKALVGVWRQVDKPDSPLRIRFSLTAGGTAFVEEWLRDSQPHSMTVYHRDRTGLVATHYCPQGNQPRLALLPPSAPKVLRFKFRDATDLDTKQESHLVALAFDLSGERTIVRSETYRRAGNEESSKIRLVREQRSGETTGRL